MHPSKLGDSYDIVKQSLLQWLAPCGGMWDVHPMFAEDYSTRYPTFNADYRKFLGVPYLTSVEPIPDKPRRKAYFERTTRSHPRHHLLLDPDTGLVPELKNNKKQHLTYEELVEIARKRPGKLILVFDQSYSRNENEENKRCKTLEKLSRLRKNGLYGIAYLSHANFILVSTDKQMIINAKRTLLEQSRLSENRLIEVLEPLD